MVTISVEGSELILEVQGLDKLWSLRSRLQIPLAHVRSIRPEPEAARRWFHGLKLAGSSIPGILTAGTFYQTGGLVFWDVHDPEGAIALELSDERYQRLIVEVADPAAAIRLVERHLKPANAR
jgi:hypothetical protein